MKLTLYPNRIPEIYGTFIALGLIMYFLIAYLAGFIHVIELRLFNLVILIVGIYLALKQFKRTHGQDLDYFRALVVGISTSAIGTSTFVVFLFIIFNLDHHLFQIVVKGEPMGLHLDVWMSTFAVWIEGIFSGVMGTFILTNFIGTNKV